MNEENFPIIRMGDSRDIMRKAGASLGMIKDAAIKESALVNRRNEVQKNPELPFALLDLFDDHFKKIDEIFCNLGKIDNKREALLAIKDLSAEIVETPDLEKYLPKDVMPYFEHDASVFKRSVIVMFKNGLLEDIDNILGQQDFNNEDIKGLQDIWSGIIKMWDAYRLIMEDLFLRLKGPDDVFDPTIDQEKPATRLFDALHWLMNGHNNKKNVDGLAGERHNGYALSGPDYTESSVFKIDPELSAKADELKVVVPHGMVLRALSNFLSNAVRKGIRSESGCVVSLTVTHDDNNLVLYFSDNGKGILAEDKKKIFLPTFTTKKDEPGGKGLAYADVRFEKAGGKIEVISPDEERGWSTTFKIIIPFVNN